MKSWILLPLLLALALLPACQSSSSSGGDDGTDTGTDSDTDTDVDTDSDTDTDTDTDTLECFEGDVFILDEEDITEIEFYPCIDGFLIIAESTLKSFSLPNLVEVSGDITVGNNTELVEFDMPALTTVGNHLVILDNPALTSVDGLGSLATVEGLINFNNNNALVSIDLDSVTTLGLQLSVQFNDVLGTVQMSSLGPVLNSLWLVGNPVLTEIDLTSVTTVVEKLQISSNSSLEDVNGFTGVTSVGCLRLNWNGLTNLDGLASITSIDGSDTCEANPYISDNPMLPDCEVCDLLEQLTTEPSTIFVENNLSDSCTPVPENCP